MKCAECNALLTERAVVVKSKKIGGKTIVLESRQALVCNEHGVVAWDPARPVSHPYLPYVPYVPAIPYRPYTPWVGTYPNTSPNRFTVWSQNVAAAQQPNHGLTVTSGGQLQATGKNFL